MADLSNMNYLAQTLGNISTNMANLGEYKTARKENFDYNELAAEHAEERQVRLAELAQKMAYKQFYDLESPDAIMKMLKEAGLSPSLYAQNAVGGGVSGISAAPSAPQGAGASGLPAPLQTNPFQVSGTYLELAQARKLNAEADQIEGKTVQAQATIVDTLASAGVKNAQKQFLDIQKDIADIEKFVKDATSYADVTKAYQEVNKLNYETNRLFWQAADANLEFEFNAATFNDRKASVSNFNAKTLAETALTKSNTKLSKTEYYKLEAEISKIYNDMWVDLDNARANITNAESYEAWVNAQIPTLAEQLRLKAQELNLANKKLWVDAGLDLFRTAGHTFGLMFMGKGKGMQMPGNPVYTPNNYGGTNGTKTWNAGKYAGMDWYGN